MAWKSAPGHTRPFSIRFASPRFRVSGGAIGNQRRNAQEARWRIALDHNDAVSSAAFSPDGSRIVAASRDRTARIWDAASGKEIAVLRHIHGVSTGGHESGLRFALRIHERQPRIRHAHLNEPSSKPDEAEALFMIGSCAAFVSYLINKARLLPLAQT